LKKNRLVPLDIANIQRAYRRYASTYNFYFGWIFHPGRQTAVELCTNEPGSRVLEVGVGTGLSLPLYPKTTRVTGIDISREMLARARTLVEEKNLTNVEALEIMDAEHTKFADDSFDCVVAMYVATVVPSPRNFVNELRRVCKPGGRIVLLNHFNDSSTLFGRAAVLLAPLTRQIGFRPNLSLAEFLEMTGLNVQNKISVNLFSLWTILVVKNEK
jgi:phosphatidylethanolamine/phosphatidyl-N-methylethanolamine N-methyltransferase